MVSQFPWLYFFVIIGLHCLLLVPYANCKLVKCRTENKRNAKCYCEEKHVHQTPWPGKNAQTAPKLRNASLRMKKNDGILLPKIGWTLDRQYLQVVDGFYIEIWMPESYYSYYVCNHSDTAIMKNFHNDLIQYDFQGCCHSLVGGFNDGNELVVVIYTLPMYAEDDNDNRIRTTLKIEDKSENKKSNVDDDYDGGGYYDDVLEDLIHKMEHLEDMFLKKEEDSDSGSFLLKVIIGTVVPIAILFMLGLFIHFHRRQIKTESPNKIRRVLFISEEGEYCGKLANRFIEIMKKCSLAKVDIVANVRKTTKIASDGIMAWMTNNVERSDVVLILTSEFVHDKSSQEIGSDVKNSPVSVAINVAESDALRTSFQTSKKKFLLLHTDSRCRKSIPYCTHYILKRDFKNMLKHALGDSYKSAVDVKDDYTQLQHLVSENSVEDETKPADVRKKVPKQVANNLDVSIMPDQTQLAPCVNDFEMVNPNPEYQSVENNEREV